MTKIININTGEEIEYPKKVHNVCAICDSSFCAEEEGGIVGGAIGMIPVNFCPFCLNGIVEMVGYISRDDGLRDE